MIAYYERVLEVLRDSAESIREDAYRALIADCVESLRSGGKVVASGLGKNVPICEKFVGTMNSMGLDARFLHTNTAVHGDLGMVGKKDVVLVLSKGGSTKETVELLGYLKERGTRTWLLTFAEKSRGEEAAGKSLKLHLEEEGDEWDIMPNNSTTMYLILLQGAALEIGKEMGVRLEEFAANHPGGGIGARLRGEDLWTSG